MSLEGQYAAEQARLRIIVELRKDESLSWTELFQRTKLSGRTLSSRLQDLQSSGFIEKISKSEESRTKNPVMRYTLSKKGVKEFAELFQPLDEAMMIEKKMAEFEQLLFDHARVSGGKDIGTVSKKYFDTLVIAVIDIFEIELLRNTSGSYRNDYVSSEILSIVRKMLWENDFVKKFERETKHSLEAEKKANERKLDLELKNLRREISRSN